MKALRFALSLLCWTLLFSLWGAAAQAAGFAPALTVEEGRPGGVVEVAFPYDGSLGEVAAFRTQVEYDPTVLEYLRPTYGESVQAGTVTTQNTPGKVASVYTAPAGGPYLAAEDAIVYRFRILESAVPGLATVFASAFELSTPEPAAIPEDVDVSLSFQVLEPPSSDARLLSLAPDHGQLQPAFDPDVFAYTMTVPYEVEAITFTAEPVPGAACRVNRKNLGSGGSDTLFRITVTAEDGETKNEYHVTVHRQEKEEEEKPELNSDAYLLSLTPATGTLTPAFDPDIYQYNLTVPFEVTTMTFTAEVPEGATYRVNRKNLGAGGSDTVFEITVTAADGETRQVYTVTVHRSEKAVSTGGAGTGSGSSGGGSASQSSGDGDSDTSSGGTEASPERESTEETVPVAGGVGESSSPGGGEGDTSPEGNASGGLVFQNGETSRLPALLVLVAFILFCFLSGPLAKMLAKRFPQKEEPTGK